MGGDIDSSLLGASYSRSNLILGCLAQADHSGRDWQNLLSTVGQDPLDCHLGLRVGKFVINIDFTTSPHWKREIQTQNVSSDINS